MAEQVVEKVNLGVAAEQMVGELKQLFPQAEILIQGETYGDAEDIVVKIFADEEDLLEISAKAHKASLEYELKTGYFIMPMVIPMKHCPIK
jgi:hypothetical protein